MPEPAIYDLPRLYDLLVPSGPCEDFYREEARRSDRPILELACGTGRLTIPIALAGGEIIGLDASLAMLATARSKARRAGVRRARFITGDMRRFSLERRFALVIVSCNSLAHLTSRDDITACFGCIRRHLAPGGRIAFDVVNPDVAVLARAAGAYHRRETLPGDVVVEECAEYDAVRQVRTSWWRVTRPGAARQDLASLALRQFFPQELPVLLEACGLSLVARFGDFERGRFRAESPNQICLAEAVSQ